jgi:hypothetical protein
MMTQLQRDQKAIKKMNKKKKLRQLGPLCLKLLKDGFTLDGVESVYNVYLKYHLIIKDIQSGFNTMDHDFTTAFNHHPKQIW